MSAFDFIFYILSFLTIASACIVVFAKRIVYAAFSLMFTFFGVAGIYVMLGADFLAVTQVLVYVGGILVLLLFGIMMTHQGEAVEGEGLGSTKKLPGLLVAGFILFLLIAMTVRTAWEIIEPGEATPTTARIGNELMTDFILPFEVASILLLAALIGAAYLARGAEEAK